MKSVVIIYHSNIKKIYELEWIRECLESISNQTYKEYDIYELNYGDDELVLMNEYRELFKGKKIYYSNQKMKNHSYAMNYLLDIAFVENDYDIVFNTNLDDIYSVNRFKYQADKLREGYDLVSSNFIIFGYRKNKTIREMMDVSYHTYRKTQEEYISEEFEKGHNIICHPCVAYSRRFWKMVGKYEDIIPEEDFILWKKALGMGLRFKIVSEYLLYYRNHEKQITTLGKSEIAKDYRFDNANVLEKFIDEELGDGIRVKIGVCFMCTGEYKKLFNQLYESFDKYFMPRCEKIYFMFTDVFIEGLPNNVNQYIIKHREGFEHNYYRYHNITLIEEYIREKGVEVIYFCDIDTKINKIIPTTFLPTIDKPFVAIAHPFFYKISLGKVETRTESEAYIDKSDEREHYIAAGMQGGLIDDYMKASEELKNMIDKDRIKGIKPLYYDESYWNKYMVKNRDKFDIKSPEYYYPKRYNLHRLLHNKIKGLKEEEKEKILGRYLPFTKCDRKIYFTEFKYKGFI